MSAGAVWHQARPWSGPWISACLWLLSFSELRLCEFNCGKECRRKAVGLLPHCVLQLVISCCAEFCFERSPGPIPGTPSEPREGIGASDSMVQGVCLYHINLGEERHLFTFFVGPLCEGVAGFVLTSSPAKHRWVAFRRSVCGSCASSWGQCASRMAPTAMGITSTKNPPRPRTRLSEATPTTLRSCLNASPVTPAGIGATASPRDSRKEVVEGTGEAVRFTDPSVAAPATGGGWACQVS